MQHLCSRTLKPSLTESFVDSWTSSLEDSRVSHSQLLESVKLLKTQDTSSPTSQTESESANLELFSLKTYRESSPAKLGTESQFSSMSSESWKEWVTEQRQEYSQRKKSAHLIRESESSSLGWPTARTSDAEGGRIETEMTNEGFKSKRHRSNQTFGAKLRDAVETHEENWPTPTIAEVSGGMRLDQIKSGKWNNIQLREKIALLEEEKQKNWATPNVCGNHNRKGASKTSGDGLSTQVKSWATPSTMDHLNVVRKPEERSEKAKKGGCKNLREEVMQPQNWATPIANDAKGSDYAGTKENPKALYLGGQVKNWPTPTTAEGTKIGNQPNFGQVGLSNHPSIVGQPDRAKLNKSGKSQESWPTPRANKVHPEITEENREHLANRNKANLEEDIAGHCGKATGKLNPNWVEHLMGLTVGWTDLGSWETE